MLSQLCRQSAASDKLWWGSTTSVSLYRCRSPACKELDSTVQYDIIIFTYCRAAYPGGLHAQQSETAHSAAAGQFASTPANRDRSAVPARPILRSARLGAGEVRDAAPGAARRTLNNAGGGRLWLLAAIVLPGVSRLRTRWPWRSGCPQAWSQGGAQADRRGRPICARTAASRSPATSERTGATYRAALWRDRSSAQHRARFDAQSKKRPVAA